MEAIQYSGWSDASYVHVLPPGSASANVSVTATVVQQLDGIAYNIEVTTTTSRRGLPERVPLATHEDVRIYTWNCRGIPRVTFRPNLFTLRTMTHSNVVVLTETCACERNARQLLCQAHGLNYFHTNTLGFAGRESILWDTSKVFLYGFHTDAYHVSFIVKELSIHQLLLALLTEWPLLICSHLCTGSCLTSQQEAHANQVLHD